MMNLTEPILEFVPINLSMNITTGSSTGGGQYCIASQKDADNCPGSVNLADWTGGSDDEICVDWDTDVPV